MKLHSCAVCDRPFARPRLAVWTIFYEEVCRACYMWAVEAMYGPIARKNLMTAPFPHGVFFDRGAHAYDDA